MLGAINHMGHAIDHDPEAAELVFAAPGTRVVTAVDGQRYLARLTMALTTPLGRLTTG